GNIDLDFFWRAAATSGNVVFQATLSCAGDAAVDDTAFNAFTVVIDAAKGTANQLNKASIAALPTTGCAADRLAHLKIMRDRTHASDTITGVVSLANVRMILRKKAQ